MIPEDTAVYKMHIIITFEKVSINQTDKKLNCVAKCQLFYSI